jgi:cytochrome c oxidase assembly protein subunit 15
MTVDDFKRIWYMEWGHRMFGRMIGVVFAVPAVYFATKRYFTSALVGRLGGLFLMGGAQGLIGWWMVKSGLEEPTSEHDKRFSEPRVSPYRLATHLISAFVIYSFLFSTALKVYAPAITSVKAPPKLQTAALVLNGLIGLTAFSGAFVAGNDV